MSRDILERYYRAFNTQDKAGMLALVSEEIVHEPCQGEIRSGREAFAAFLDHMDICYREQVLEPVFLISEDGSRGAAEFLLEGTYQKTDGDLPAAHGQKYRLRVGTFFAFGDGTITRVSNHYNLADWIAQISA